jgi:hypothetical protein
VVAVAAAAAVLLPVAGYAASACTAAATVSSMHMGALLGAPRSAPAQRLDTLSAATVRSAVAAVPLDQRIANVAMVRDARRDGGARAGAWLAVLSQLGWRDTEALQNMLGAAAVARDLPRILDVGDALLRRRQLMDQIIPALSMLEMEPRLRDVLAARLAARPGWRGAYLTTTGQLSDRARLLARFGMMRLLQRRGVALDRGEVVPNIDALDRAGLPAHGFALWQGVEPRVTRPLDDVRFAEAGRSYRADVDPVPYQWQMMTGEGFGADASDDGGRTMLTIDWAGRGVPVFAQQRSSAAPGRYALRVDVAPEDRADLSAITFRLTCANVIMPFHAVAPGRYVTAGAVPCDFPTFQIAGDLQPAATTHDLSIRQITMTPLAARAG